jgi:Zn-dependent protease with chaperone function
VNNFVKLLAAWVFRLSLLAAALIFMAGLLFVAALLLSLWLLRALWAKLTGQPVQPWVFKMNRADLWQRAYRGAAPGANRGQTPEDVIDAEVTDVTDVTEIKEKLR